MQIIRFRGLTRVKAPIAGEYFTEYYGKPMYGGVFGYGEWVLVAIQSPHTTLIEIHYMVLHGRAGLLISGPADTKREAISGARDLLRQTPGGVLTQLIAEASVASLALEEKLERERRPEPSGVLLAPRSIPKRRKEIFDASEGRCHYCSVTLEIDNFHIEHKTPKSRGGTNDRRNLVASCVGCNMKKSTKTAEEFQVAG
jgi:HNH endonuclease